MVFCNYKQNYTFLNVLHRRLLHRNRQCGTGAREEKEHVAVVCFFFNVQVLVCLQPKMVCLQPKSSWQ